MQISFKTLEGLKRLVTVQIPEEQIKQKYDRRIREEARKTNLKGGFRAGKMPLHREIERRYGKAIRDDVVKALAFDALYKAIDEKKLRLATTPTIKKLNAAIGQAVELDAELEILPVITLKALDGVEVELVTAKVNDQAIAQAIEHLRKQHIIWQQVTRLAQTNDQVILSFKGFKHDKLVKSSVVKELSLVLGAGRMPKEFEQAIEGMAVGEEKSIAIDYPNTHTNKDIAGEHVVFKVEIHGIREPKLPEIDDNFISDKLKIRGGKAALEKKITDTLALQLQTIVKDINKQIIMDKFLALNEIPQLPQSLVEKEIKILQELEGGGQAPNTSQNNDKGKKYHHQAKRKVALGLLIGEYANEHNIKIDAKRVEQLVVQSAQGYKQSKEMIEWCFADRTRLAPFEWRALEDQVVESLLASVKGKEKIISYQDAVVRLTKINH